MRAGRRHRLVPLAELQEQATLEGIATSGAPLVGAVVVLRFHHGASSAAGAASAVGAPIAPIAIAWLRSVAGSRRWTAPAS